MGPQRQEKRTASESFLAQVKQRPGLGGGAPGAAIGSTGAASGAGAAASGMGSAAEASDTKAVGAGAGGRDTGAAEACSLALSAFAHLLHMPWLVAFLVARGGGGEVTAHEAQPLGSPRPGKAGSPTAAPAHPKKPQPLEHSGGPESERPPSILLKRGDESVP